MGEATILTVIFVCLVNVIYGFPASALKEELATVTTDPLEIEIEFSPRITGECKGKDSGNDLQCTKYGFYEVKQCKADSDKCQCVDPWDGEVSTTKVSKDEDCPPCLMDSAESLKMTAEGMMDTNSYGCIADGFYDDENVQCQWFACFCYSRDGDIAHMLTEEERRSPSFSCKSFTSGGEK